MHGYSLHAVASALDHHDDDLLEVRGSCADVLRFVLGAKQSMLSILVSEMQGRWSVYPLGSSNI